MRQGQGSYRTAAPRPPNHPVVVVPGAAGCEWLRKHGSFVLLYGNAQAGSVTSCRALSLLSYRPYEPWDEIVILDKREHPLHAAVIVSVCTHGLATTSLPPCTPRCLPAIFARDRRILKGSPLPFSFRPMHNPPIKALNKRVWRGSAD